MRGFGKETKAEYRYQTREQEKEAGVNQRYHNYRKGAYLTYAIGIAILLLLVFVSHIQNKQISLTVQAHQNCPLPIKHVNKSGGSAPVTTNHHKKVSTPIPSPTPSPSSAVTPGGTVPVVKPTPTPTHKTLGSGGKSTGGSSGSQPIATPTPTPVTTVGIDPTISPTWLYYTETYNNQPAYVMANLEYAQADGETDALLAGDITPAPSGGFTADLVDVANGGNMVVVSDAYPSDTTNGSLETQIPANTSYPLDSGGWMELEWQYDGVDSPIAYVGLEQISVSTNLAQTGTTTNPITGASAPSYGSITYGTPITLTANLSYALPTAVTLYSYTDNNDPTGYSFTPPDTAEPSIIAVNIGQGQTTGSATVYGALPTTELGLSLFYEGLGADLFAASNSATVTYNQLTLSAEYSSLPYSANEVFTLSGTYPGTPLYLEQDGVQGDFQQCTTDDSGSCQITVSESSFGGIVGSASYTVFNPISESIALSNTVSVDWTTGPTSSSWTAFSSPPTAQAGNNVTVYISSSPAFSAETLYVYSLASGDALVGSCTTDSAGSCQFNFTDPSADGYVSYEVEASSSFSVQTVFELANFTVDWF